MPDIHPVYTADEATQHATFAALLNALSYPGRLYDLPSGDPFALIGRALLDLETSYCTPNEALDYVLAQTGARQLSPAHAAYHFYPDALDLDAVEAAGMGDMLYPDTAATLIIRCDFSGTNYSLSGPGVQGTITAALGITGELWSLRDRALYPLGWDVFLTDGRRVMGIPRTARVQALTAEEA